MNDVSEPSDAPEPVAIADEAAASVVNATSGFTSALAPEDATLANAIESFATSGLTDADLEALTKIAHLGDLQHGLHVHADPELAIDSIIWAIRSSSENVRKQIVCVVGDDHGKTVSGRAISGRPELHEGFGPLLPGIRYVTLGDPDQANSVIDDSVCAFVFCPVNLDAAASVVDRDWLNKVGEICNALRIPVIANESRLPLGIAGNTFQSAFCCDFQIDLTVASSGWFGALPGGLVLESPQMEEKLGFSLPAANPDSFASSSLFFPTPDSIPEFIQLHGHVGLSAKTAAATWRRVEELGGFDPSLAPEFASDLAQAIGGFEFVRDMNVTGGLIGIETDIPADELVDSATRCGLVVQPAGPTAIALALPSVWRTDDYAEHRAGLIQRMTSAIESIERQTIEP